MYFLTAKIDFSDLYSISGEELIIIEENWWTSYMELFPTWIIRKNLVCFIKNESLKSLDGKFMIKFVWCVCLSFVNSQCRSLCDENTQKICHTLRRNLHCSLCGTCTRTRVFDRAIPCYKMALNTTAARCKSVETVRYFFTQVNACFTQDAALWGTLDQKS